MALKVGCVMCGNELQEPGAILIASPTDVGLCAKYHICIKCQKIDIIFITKEMLQNKKAH